MSQSQTEEFLKQYREEMLNGIDRNLEAQTRFLEAWSDAIADATDDEMVASGATGVANAYETWLNATERVAERAAKAAAGEPVEPTEFRDIWLRAANDSLQELMGTQAFARLTGEQVSSMLDLQRQTDEAIQDTIEDMGFATAGQIEEVGARLVELERRQHEVEQRLDAILDHLEDA